MKQTLKKQCAMGKTFRETLIAAMAIALFVGSNLQAANQGGREKWPDSVPYTLNTGSLSSGLQAQIALAVTYNNQRSALTGFTLVERTNESDYIRYNGGTSNSATVGLYSGRHDVTLVSENKAVVMHETLHVIGFKHEHQRRDRDNHLTDATDSLTGRWQDGNGPYDYGSVMHYGDQSVMVGAQLFYQRIGLTYTDMYSAGQFITDTNYLPLSYDDYYSLEKNTSISVPVTTVWTASHLALMHNDGDYNGDVLTVSLVSDVSNGTLSLNSDGSFDYTPNTDFVGTDSFTYKLNDGTGDSEVATATITVCASAPLATPQYYKTVAEAREKVYAEEGTNFSLTVLEVEGATSYEWVLQQGATLTSLSADGLTADVEMGPHSGYILCFATNADGRSQPFMHFVNVEIDPAAPSTSGAISGPTGVEDSQTGVAYSVDRVRGATDYTWTVPSGATIISGQGTNGITVDYGSSIGQVTVTASNIYGTSAAQSLDVLTVESTESALVVTTLANDQFLIVLTGTPGALYAIDVSVDLQNWQQVTTVTVDGNGTVTYTDIDPLLARRFYRARRIP